MDGMQEDSRRGAHHRRSSSLHLRPTMAPHFQHDQWPQAPSAFGDPPLVPGCRKSPRPQRRAEQQRPGITDEVKELGQALRHPARSRPPQRDRFGERRRACRRLPRGTPVSTLRSMGNNGLRTSRHAQHMSNWSSSKASCPSSLYRSVF